MNRLSTATSCTIALVVVFGVSAIADAKDYPPTTELMDQVLVAKQPDRSGRYGATAVRLITRGYEAIYFSIKPGGGSKAPRWFVYDTAQKKITAVSGEVDLPSSEPTLRDDWAAMDRWRRYFTPAGREDLLAIEHLEEGFSCHARQGRSPGKPAEIFVDRASADSARLCALEPYEGRTLHQVHWLRLMPSGCVAVLASDGKVTVLQIYENPMLDAIGAQWNALMNHAYRGEPTVRARYLGSLYDFSEYADRGFDPFLLASDGRVYFGTMPHHSSESGPIFCFAPQQRKLTLLGDIARMAGVHQPGAAPHMMHSGMIEMNGKIYFTGQDCHYAGWNFPCEREEDRARYLGSPLVEYDPQTTESRSLGIPLPGDHALFRIKGDPARNTLYVRRGYDRRHYGPLVWYRLALDEQGDLSGKPQKLPFGEHPAAIHIGPDGSVFGVVPDLKLQETFQQKSRARESTDQITPTCYLYRCDPPLRRAERLTTLTGTWDIRWATGQTGESRAIGMGDDHIYELNLKTGAIRATVKRPDIQVMEMGPGVVRENTMYLMPRVLAKDRSARRTTAVYTVDLQSGKTLYHGVIVDNQGRWPKDLNRFIFLPDGRIFVTGTVYGLPSDKNYMPRYRDSEPFRLDCAALMIDELPPGKPVEPQVSR